MARIYRKGRCRPVVKKKLLEMKPLYATKKMMRMAEADIPKTVIHKNYCYTYSEARCRYGLFMRCQVVDGLLRTAIYLPESMRLGARQPAYEVFIDRDARRHITYDRVEGKWRTAKLDYIPWPNSVALSNQRWMSAADEKAVKAYLNSSVGGYDGILAFQYEICEERLLRRHRKETDKWDADLALTPALPKDWTRWVDKVGIPQNYIFYHYEKRGTDHGYCSFCEKEVPIKEKPRHNKKGRCPCCRHEVIYKADGRIGRLHTDVVCVYLLQNRPDGFMVREFWAYRDYTEGAYISPAVCCKEQIRLVCNQNLEVRPYYWGDYKQRGCRWIGGTPPYSYYGYGYSYYCRSGQPGEKRCPILSKDSGD